MTIPITIALIAIMAGLCALAQWRLARPADPLNPRLVPWRTILVFAGFCAVLFGIHLIHLLFPIAA